MNPALEQIASYPFERKRELLAGIHPSLTEIDCTIGEPRHTPPQFVLEKCSAALASQAHRYPPTKQKPELSDAIANWGERNLGRRLNPENILALAGSGEGLYSLPFALIDRSSTKNVVLLPNPAYQVYEGATRLAGGEPFFLNLEEEHNFQPDFNSVPPEIWERTVIMYLNFPSNPCAVNAKAGTIEKVLALSKEYDFVILSDECYFDIYFNEKPGSILSLTEDLHNVMAFHSLSKRSSLAGLRSGFMAGDPEIIQRYLKMRMMERKAVPLYVQDASIAAWNDEQHVAENKHQYQEKVDGFVEIVGNRCQRPESTFFIWFKVPEGYTDERFTAELYQQQGVAVLPGSYLARDGNRGNPGRNFVRIALVDSLEQTREVAARIKTFMKGGTSK